ncbi:MAG: hypothetical protein VB027_06780 [Gordonibacter sp.]|nr:hypothetical protein [Gordonibacter sp.]
MKGSQVAAIAVRMATAVVFIVNVQCALSFVLQPAAFTDSFELASAGVAGDVAVRGLGVAFLMWNTTYPAVIVDPRRFRVLHIVVLAQQIIGLVGELIIRLTLPPGAINLTASIDRFIAFDAFGLVIMASTLAVLIIADRRTKQQAAINIQTNL